MSATTYGDSDQPLHAQIRSHLLDHVESGNLRPGDQLPTETELMTQFVVSRTTVRRALHDLAVAQVIVRSPGRGSFVAQQRIEQDLRRLTGFVEDMQAVGLKATAIVVTNERLRAVRDVARQLQIRIGETVVHIERVRLANLQPVSFDDSYFSIELGQRIAEEDLEAKPFYSIIENDYAIPVGEADLVLEATEPGERIARHLDMEANAPIMRIERTTFSRDNSKPLLFEYLYYRGDRMRYRLHLSR
ncbi:MAG: GntR family transcriptional regulator [Nocardioidaceae bacterium]